LEQQGKVDFLTQEGKGPIQVDWVVGELKGLEGLGIEGNEIHHTG